MHVVASALLLLFITALSALLSRVIRLPLPLLQIALGAAARMLGMRVGLEPSVFMLLFIPPLLYSDAFLLPMREFKELRGVILTLAIGLVLFTTVGCGVFVHWLIPPLPLAVCFALAAVLSPTDAVAVAGMVEGRAVPRRFLHVLSGEALLNDASGLVCFKFAAAAAMTGAFSLPRATAGFLVVSIGGLAVGALLAAALAVVERWLLRRRFDHSPTFITASVLLPFASYLAAEHLEVSGILAAVAAGTVMRQGRVIGQMPTDVRIGAAATWGMLTYTLNGMIFLLLGLQLPDIVSAGIALSRRAGIENWRLPLTIVAITLFLTAFRLAWVWATVLLRATTARWRGNTRPAVSPRIILAMAVSGVRGALTLAAVLSLDGTFPARNLLIILAAGVIVSSLLLATIGLPPLLKGLTLPEVDPLEHEADRARLSLARAAVDAVAREQAVPSTPPDPDHGAVAARLLAELQMRMHSLSLGGDADAEGVQLALRRHRLDTAMRLRTLRVRRETLTDLRRVSTINDETERLLLRELDHEEEVLLATARSLPRPLEAQAPNRAA